GWDERAALVRWIRLCGPSPLDDYIFKFVENEVRIAGEEIASRWQRTLCDLIGFELRNGLPMELINLSTFREATRQARNAEEALIVVLHACAVVTGKTSSVTWPEKTSFGELLSRIQEQRASFRRTLILNHLGFLNLNAQIVMIKDLFL